MKVNKILERYHLLETFETEINSESKLFVKEMKKITEEGYYSSGLRILSAFGDSNKKYGGYIYDKKFKIRQRIDWKKITGTNSSKVVAEYFNENGILKIKTQIQGMGILPLLLRAILAIFYLIIMLLVFLEALLMLFSSDYESLDSGILIGPVILTLIIYPLTYLSYNASRKDVPEMKNEMEKVYEQIEKTTYNNVYN